MKTILMNHILFDNIDILISNGLLKDKSIILFGLNSSSYAMKKYLNERGYSVAAFVDNDKRKRNHINFILEDILDNHIIGCSISDKNVIKAYSPEQIEEVFGKNVIILIASKYYANMLSQLVSLGYEEDLNVFKVVDFYALENILKGEKPDMAGHVLSSSQIKDIQVSILDYVKRKCEENGLRYYLCAGTLLGAVRHGGFIPWDDDIDITMPYTDYQKLLDIIEQESIYSVCSPNHDSDNCFYFFARVFDNRSVMNTWEFPFLITSGISIDIFPIIGVPEKMEDAMEFCGNVHRLKTRYLSTFTEFYGEHDDKLLNKRKRLKEELLHLMDKYEFDDSRLIFTITKYKEKEILPRTIYQKAICMKFENVDYSVAEGYKDYLSALYGEYMKLPPKNQQKSDHNYIAYEIGG